MIEQSTAREFVTGCPHLSLQVGLYPCLVLTAQAALQVIPKRELHVDRSRLARLQPDELRCRAIVAAFATVGTYIELTFESLVHAVGHDGLQLQHSANEFVAIDVQQPNVHLERLLGLSRNDGANGLHTFCIEADLVDGSLFKTPAKTYWHSLSFSGRNAKIHFIQGNTVTILLAHQPQRTVVRGTVVGHVYHVVPACPGTIRLDAVDVQVFTGHMVVQSQRVASDVGHDEVVVAAQVSCPVVVVSIATHGPQFVVPFADAGTKVDAIHHTAPVAGLQAESVVICSQHAQQLSVGIEADGTLRGMVGGMGTHAFVGDENSAKIVVGRRPIVHLFALCRQRGCNDASAFIIHATLVGLYAYHGIVVVAKIVKEHGRHR